MTLAAGSAILRIAMSKTPHLEPARTVLEIIGIDTAARVTGRHRSRVMRWMYPRAKGGSDGLIPSEMQQRLMAYAASNNVPLRPEHFFGSPTESAA